MPRPKVYYEPELVLRGFGAIPRYDEPDQVIRKAFGEAIYQEPGEELVIRSLGMVPRYDEPEQVLRGFGRAPTYTEDDQVIRGMEIGYGQSDVPEAPQLQPQPKAVGSGTRVLVSILMLIGAVGGTFWLANTFLKSP